MTRIITFEEALKETTAAKRHLLLGNGFSIALFPDRFRYNSLLDEADFSGFSEARQVFEALGTTDFETVIEALRQTGAVLPIYSDDDRTAVRIAEHQEALKELLVQAIAGRHPERPSDITDEQFASCRAFLANFVGESRDLRPGGRDHRGKIYTLNYDLVLYWTLLHDEIIRWNEENPLDSVMEQTEPLQHDDGFRAPDDDPNASYVTWEAEGAADRQNIHFLHGALHLFDYGAELQKKCWERSGGIPLVDQIRSALNEGKFPLFVSEGNSRDKLARIRHSGYLQRSLKSFASICRPRRGHEATLFVYGHSLASNDHHVFHLIEKGNIPRLYISLYGDPRTPDNREIIARADSMAAERNDRLPLALTYFKSEQLNPWQGNE